MRCSKMVERTEEILDEAGQIARETQDPDYFRPYQWAITQFGLTHAQRYALIFLVHFFGGWQRRNGSFYISETFIKPKLPIAVGTFDNHVRALRKAGVVRMVHKALNGHMPSSQYVLQYGVYAGGKRMEHLMPYISQSEGKPSATPSTDVKADTPAVDVSPAAVKDIVPAPVPQIVAPVHDVAPPALEAALSVCSCCGAVHSNSPSVSSAAALAPVASSLIADGGSLVSQRGYADLLACVAGAPDFVSPDKRLMRDVLDTRREASVGLKPLRKGSAAAVASPALELDGLSEFGARFIGNLKARGIRLNKKKIGQARMKVERLESDFRELHGAGISLRYADYAVDETVWAREQGRKGGLYGGGDARGGVRDMVSYAISVLRRVVEDGYTGDPGYDDSADAAPEFDGAAYRAEVWDGARGVDPEVERLWERVKAEIVNAGEVARPAYRSWIEVSSGLAIEGGDTLLIGLPTLYQANHFRQVYEGTGFMGRAIEKAAGRYMDCRAYALQGD